MRNHTLAVPVVLGGILLGACFGGSTGSNPGSDGGFPGFEGGIQSEGGAEGGTATLTTTPVDFGMADCGGQPSPATKTYSFENSGAVAITWSAETDSIFAISGPSFGTVAPGATGSVTIGVSSIPATSSAGAVIAGTLTLTTNVPGYTTVLVPLKVTPQGGSLAVSPAVTGFGQQPLQTTTSPLPFTLSNVGNAPVSVTLGTPSDTEFTVTYAGTPAAATLAAGGSLVGASATFTPSSVGAKSATSAIQVTGALCASVATAVSFSGTGSAVPVSIGPSPLDFQVVPCGTAGEAQAVTIKNGGTVAITYSTLLGLGAASPFTLDAPTGSVPANGQATISVTPLPIPVPGVVTAGAYDDSLTITTTAPGASPFTIPLDESALGAILALTMASADFGTVMNATATLPFTITNTGNTDATVSVSTTGANFSAVLTQNDIAAANGGTAPGNADFLATINGSASGTLSVTTTTPVCGALPDPINLTAVSAVPVVTSTPGSLAVSAEGKCFTEATLTLQNTGGAPATVSVGGSSLGYFSVVSASASIPQGGSGSIVIRGIQSVGVKGGTDTLTFTTNEPVNATHTVPVTLTVPGGCG